MSYPIESALFQWEEGWGRLQTSSIGSSGRRQAELAVEAVRDQLRRRIGPTFTVAELAALYAEGTEWCAAVVTAVAPEPPIEPQSLADAAFWAYLRGARDFAGGRPLALD